MDVGCLVSSTSTSFKPKYVSQYRNTKNIAPFMFIYIWKGVLIFFNAIHPDVLLDTKE